MNPPAPAIVGLVRHGAISDMRFPIDPMAVIGREPSTDVVLPDPRVSRLHARLELVANGQLLVEDLGSRNGTLVGGQVLQRRSVTLAIPLALQIGPYTMVVHEADGAVDRTLSMQSINGNDQVGYATSRPSTSLAPSASALERRLLTILEAHSPHPVASAEIAHELWGQTGWAPYMLYNLVSRCRRAMLAAGETAKIVGVRGFGYRIEFSDAAQATERDAGLPRSPLR